MSKQEKTAEKIQRRPTPKDITWRELRSYLISLNFEEIQKDGARVKFVLREAPDGRGAVLLLFHVPHPKPEVKPVYIRQAVEVLKSRGVL